MEEEQRVVRRWRALSALVGLALAGTVGAGLLASRPPAGHGRHQTDIPAPAAATRRLAAEKKLETTWRESKCKAYPWLNFTENKPMWSNLGNKGPMFGVGDGEGLVYRTLTTGTGWGPAEGRKVLLIFNATNPTYKPFSPNMNGRQGFYGSINLQSGSYLDLKISFKDEQTMQPVQLKQISITFFDLDMDKKGQSMESVSTSKFEAFYLEPHTEIKRENVQGDLWKFESTTFGTGADNPKDPNRLTPQQRNRAVTFFFENVVEIHVTIAASHNKEPCPRFFTFVMRPSLLCQGTALSEPKPPSEPKTTSKPKPSSQPNPPVQPKPSSQPNPPVRQAGLPYTPSMEYPVTCASGMSFERWLKSRGEDVKKGEAIVLLTNKGGQVQTIKADRAGTIVKTGDIMKGVSCNTNTSIAVVKKAMLPALTGSPAAVADKGQTFVKFLKPVGAIVEKDNPIVLVDSPDGEKTLNASREGFIESEQTTLQKGDLVDLIEDRNLATFGKLKPLKVTPGEGFAIAPSKGIWLFKKWMVEVDDKVEQGDPVAVLVDNQGIYKTVRASKDGKIVARQERLRPGYKLNHIMSDTDLAVIGKFLPLEPKGWRGVAICASEDAVFKGWKVKKGDYVEKGDPVAEVQLPGRRLSNGRTLASIDSDINSPAWGVITDAQPLLPGERIGDQQVGPNIATLDMGTPWWVWMFTGLLVLCCVLCCIFVFMKKPKPEQQESYTPMQSEEDEGLRLDFEGGGKLHTVYAKYRPLGIKHNDSAPIIAHEFTVNSYAKMDLGVKVGWKLTRIGDVELNDNPDFGEVNSLLQDWMVDFPLWPLNMIFKDGSTEVTAQFLERPLGFEFSNSVPVYVSKVYDGSPAHKQGVKEGMLVAQVGEMDVRNNRNFREVSFYFKEGANPLDHNGKTYS